MPLDPELSAALAQVPPEAMTRPKLDSGVRDALAQTGEQVARRREYLRDKYVWGLVAPLSGTRDTYSEKALKEVTDPEERRWLVGEVAKIAKAREWAEQEEYNEAGYLGRLGKRVQKVGGSFAEAGTGMTEAAGKLRDWTQGKGRSQEDVQFARALEGAKQGENPYLGKDAPLSLKAAAGAAGMAPDMAAGLLANAAGGPAAMMGYWTAREQPEAREDFLEMGLSSGASSLAGTATAAAVGGIELLNIDPTGLTRGAAKPIKGIARRALAEAVEKIGGKAASSLVRHPVTRRVVGAGVDALKRTGLEAVEEGLQGGVQEGAKLLVGGETEDRHAIDVLAEGYSQAKEALPGLAVLGGVGGAVRAGESVVRYKRFAEGSKQAKTLQEIAEVVAKGHAPARAQWEKWGLPAEEGKTRKQRLATAKKIVKSQQTIDQLKFVVAGVTPTAAQWRELGLPAKEGKTEEGRQKYLVKKFVPQMPPAQAAVPSPVTAAQGETASLEPVGQPSETAAVQPGPQQVAAQETRAAQGTAPAEHDFPVEMEGTGERIGGRELVRRVEQIWDVPIRSGRTRMRAARGIYKLKQRVSRLAKGEEASVAVAVHEVIGHHLDNTSDVLKSAPAEAKAEVAKLDYDQSKLRDFEGFAEFVRAYLTGATETHKGGVDLADVAPKFLAHFEQWVEAHPEVKAKLDATREPLEAFKRAGAPGRVKGQISETGIDEERAKPLLERVNEWKEYLYTQIKEEGRPVKRFVDAAKKEGYDPGDDTTPFEDYNALRQVGPHFAAMAIERGVFKLSGQMERVGPSLSDALAEIEPGEDYTNFIAWAYARHAAESWDREKNPVSTREGDGKTAKPKGPGITREDAKETMRQLYDPRYEAAADALTQFNNALIEVLADVGVIDQKTKQIILAEYKYYIPLERAKQGARGGGGRRMVDLSSAIKGRRGSGLQIIDPVESTISRAIRLYERAAQQIVVNKLVEVAEGTEGLGKWVCRVPPGVIATEFKFDEIKAVLKKEIEAESGVDADPLLDLIDPMLAMTIWRPDLAKVNGQPIVRVTQDGKPVFYYLDSQLAESLGGLETMQALDIATRTARAFTGMLKIGATRFNPDFYVSNGIRDLETFLMQGEKGLKGAFDPARYVALYVVSELRAAAGEKGSPVVELFQQMGGELSTYAGLDRARLRAGRKRALAGRQGKVETAINIAGVTEVGPRIAEFAAILGREGWLERVEAGETPPLPVLVRAVNASHDVTVDFRRLGKWGRYLNYYIPFFNARLEGLDKFVRTFKDHPGRSTMRVGLNIVPLALTYWWYRHDDDDYKERPEWQDSFFVLKNAEGEPVWRIPKSQEWGLIESGIERMMDAMYDKDPKAVTRWFEQVLDTANPGGLPAGVTPMFETLFNYDAFRDRPIVSDALQKLEGPDQYYDYTSKVAKGVAEMLHKVSGGKVSLSPAKIDHLANGLSGGLYGKVNAPVDKIASGEYWTAHDIPGMKGITFRKDYTKSVDDFYAKKESLDKSHESNKLHGGEREEDLDSWRRCQYVSALLTDIRKAARNLPAEDRSAVDRARTGLARAALQREPLERYPNPLTDPNAVPPAVRKVILEHIAKKAIGAAGETDTAVHSGRYLEQMGVMPGVAKTLAYDRLRNQGTSREAAENRAKMIGFNFR